MIRRSLELAASLLRHRSAAETRHKSHDGNLLPSLCLCLFAVQHLYISHPVVLFLSQSRRLPLLQVVSNNKSFSVGVQSLTEINAPRGCAKNMSAFADQNHAPSLTCVRLEMKMFECDIHFAHCPKFLAGQGYLCRKIFPAGIR